MHCCIEAIKKPHPKVRQREAGRLSFQAGLVVRHVSINFACKVKCRQVAFRRDGELLLAAQAMLAAVGVLPDNFDAGDVGVEGIHNALLLLDTREPVCSVGVVGAGVLRSAHEQRAKRGRGW